MEHSQKPTTPIALHVPKRTVFIMLGVAVAVVVLIVSSTLVVQNQANQIEAINAYQTQCYIGTLGAESYVFIYAYYGTSTPKPTYTPITMALTERANDPHASRDQTMVAMSPLASATPAAVSTLYLQPDAKRGEIVFNGVGNCFACHDTKLGIGQVGPSLMNIPLISQARVPGVAPELYLKESILAPNNYIVPGFAPDVMPKNYATNLTNIQINDLIAYMMTLK
ncbi:MAG: cytochrome c [Anaerolineae bacterium]|nr:cytochrome c [Anaerolineae bacterium]